MEDEEIEDFLLRTKLIAIQQEASGALLELMETIITRLEKIGDGEQKNDLCFLYERAKRSNQQLTENIEPFLKRKPPKLVLVKNNRKK